MKERAHRFLAIYVVLLAGLAFTRFATHKTYPTLLELQDHQSQLLNQRDELNREIDGLQSAKRIREWANKHAMIPYTIAPHESLELPSLLEPVASPPAEKVKVSIEWR